MKKVMVVSMVALLACAVTAQAAFTYIVENRSGGQNVGQFSTTGTWADVSGGSTAAGLTPGIGHKYSAGYTGRSATYRFTPASTGYYNVHTTWVTSANNVNPVTYTVSRAGASIVVDKDQSANGNSWVSLATAVKLNSGTQYQVSQAVTIAGLQSKNHRSQAVRWQARTPAAPTLTGGPSNGAIDVLESGTTLTWTAGNYNTFFDVFLQAGTNPPVTVAATNLVEGTTSYATGALLPNTTYYWKVKAKNVDMSAESAVWSFTTTPEPITSLFMGLGGLLFLRRRHG